ncbi:MAG TPA: hypothetical protein P5560_02965 [Thermotogota bacterium]|nr:hypothetical protein [Thermotogota bacterium]HRW91891.1 hypothetical protein [Thermotogota bacterium]
MWFSRKQKKSPLLVSSGTIFKFFVQCERCGELFEVVVRKHSEIFQTFGKGNGAYEIRKELVGSHCQQKIQVLFVLDANFRMKEYQVQGGKLLTLEEYQNLREEKNE